MSKMFTHKSVFMVRLLVVLVTICSNPGTSFSNDFCQYYGHYMITRHPAVSLNVVSYVGTKGPWECNGACGDGCTNAGGWFDSGNDTRYTQNCLEHDQVCSYQSSYLLDFWEKANAQSACILGLFTSAGQYADPNNDCTVPSIRDVSPAFASPGDIIRITGDNFQANGNTVYFGISTFFDNAEILSQSDNLIIAIVPQPSNHIRTVNITVDTHDRGRAEKALAFTYLNLNRTNRFKIVEKSRGKILSADAIDSRASWPQQWRTLEDWFPEVGHLDGGLPDIAKWYMIPTGDGYVRLVNAYTGLCLSSGRDGRLETKMWLCGDEADGEKQQWKIEPVDNEYYTVINKVKVHLDFFGLNQEFTTCLDSVSDRTNSAAFDSACTDGSTKQMWKFVEFPVTEPVTGVSASDGSGAIIDISWQPVTGATYYQVYRNTTNDSNGATPVWSAGWFPNTYFSDGTAIPGQTYYYWVKAATSVSGANASAFSASDSGWCVLAMPGGVSATDGTYKDHVEVKWSGVYYASGTYYYQVYRNTANNSAGATAISSWQTSVSYLDYKVTPGTTYYYWVKAATSSSGANVSGFSWYDPGYAAATLSSPFFAEGAAPTWSRDGQRLAFEKNGNISTIAASGGDEKQITTMPAPRAAWGPVYQPQSNRIYYLDNSPTGADYWWISWTSDDGSAGRNTVKMVPGGDGFTNPKFSDDGRQLCYIHSSYNEQRVRGARRDLMITNADGSNTHSILRDDTIVDGVSWGRGSNRNRLLYVKLVGSVQSLFTINMDGSGETRITGTDVGNCYQPKWSADGQEFVFAKIDPAINIRQIYAISSQGTNLRQLTTSAGDKETPEVSPDGAKLVYVTKQDGRSVIVIISNTPTSTPKPAIPGDLNGDGKVDIFDVQAVISCIFKIGRCDGSDINKDGKYNIFDVLRVIQIITKP